MFLVVSRLGLEPMALTLKAPTLLRKINRMILLNLPMSGKDFQSVARLLSYIGHRYIRCYGISELIA
jgi:hypothetical protein